jgi:hypothetical protein
LTALDLAGLEDTGESSRTLETGGVCGTECLTSRAYRKYSHEIGFSEEGFIVEYNIRRKDEFTRTTTYKISELSNATVTRLAWMPEQ